MRKTIKKEYIVPDMDCIALNAEGTITNGSVVNMTTTVITAQQDYVGINGSSIFDEDGKQIVDENSSVIWGS